MCLAPYHASLLDLGGVSELGRLAERLLGQLARGREEERDGTVAAGQQRLRVDVHDGGKNERESLTGTSGGDSDHIATGQSHGPEANNARLIARRVCRPNLRRRAQRRSPEWVSPMS